MSISALSTITGITSIAGESAMLDLAIARWEMRTQEEDFGVLLDRSGNGHHGDFGGVKRAFIGDDYDGGRGLKLPGIPGNYASIEEEFQRASDAAQVNVSGVLTTATRGLNGLRDAHYVTANDATEYRTTLLEGARTNGWTFPEALDNVAWGKTRSTISADAIVGPEGAGTADKLVEDSTASSSHYIGRNTPALTDDTDQTTTVFAKAAERTWVALYSLSKDGSERRTWFDLANGVVGTVQSGHTARIESKGNGWHRCEIRWDPLSGGTTPQSRFFLADADNNLSYNGDGSSGLYLWGLDFEVDQPFASSYTPGKTAAFTRAADSLFKPYVDAAGDAVAADQPITIYTKHVELGTAAAQNFLRYWHIGSFDLLAEPRLTLTARSVNGTLFFEHEGADTVAINAQNPAAAAAANDLVESRSVVVSDGIFVGQSINGAAEDVTAKTSGTPLRDANWADATFYIGSPGAANQGYAGFVLVFILAGEKSLAQCQAATRTDSNVLFWYEPGDDVFNASIVGNIDVQWFGRLADWTPATTQNLADVWAGSTDLAFRFVVVATGALLFQHSEDGTVGTIKNHTSSAATGVADDTEQWLRFTLNAATGDGTFYLGGTAEEPVWAQLGIVVAGVVTNIHDSFLDLAVGAMSDGTTEPTDGLAYRLRIYSDLTETNKVVDVDFRTQAQGDRVFHSYNGALVEVNQAGSSTAEPELKFYNGTVFVWYPGTASNNTEITLTPTTTYDYTITYEDGSTDTDSQASDGGGVLTFGDTDAKFTDLDVRRIAVEPSGGGALVADLNFDLSTTVEQVAGAAITINRSASGYKTTVVDETKAVGDGVNDYIEIDDHDDLDFGAGDSFMVGFRGAVHGSPAAGAWTLIAKQGATATVGQAGYAIYQWNSGTTFGTIADGAAGTEPSIAGLGTGEAKFVALRRDVLVDNARLFLDGIGGTALTDASTATLANAHPLRIGSASGSLSNLLAGEFMGAPVFDRALTDAQLEQLNRELS